MHRLASRQRPGGEPLIADLSSQASVRRLAAEVLARYPKLDVLVNNAGAMYGTRQLTKDGIELAWAVNHLAPILLSKLLLHRLKESAPARIITTASQAHQGRHIRFDDLNGERSYRGFGRYCETKLANIVGFVVEERRMLLPFNIGMASGCQTLERLAANAISSNVITRAQASTSCRDHYGPRTWRSRI